MVIKYTIDRKSLIDGEYCNAKEEIIKGGINDKITYKTHLSVIYGIIKARRRVKSNE